jgi:Fe2+ or Zn2+ uptake regulation protein
VYNTLNTLVDVGMLRTFKLPHSGKVIYDNNTHDHYHFLDEETGNLYDIESQDVSIEMKVPHRFKVNAMEIVLRGAVRRPDIKAVRRPDAGAVRRPDIKAARRPKTKN